MYTVNKEGKHPYLFSSEPSILRTWLNAFHIVDSEQIFVGGISWGFSCVYVFIFTIRLNIPLHIIYNDRNLYFIYFSADSSRRYSHNGKNIVLIELN